MTICTSSSFALASTSTAAEGEALDSQGVGKFDYVTGPISELRAGARVDKPIRGRSNVNDRPAAAPSDGSSRLKLRAPGSGWL